MLVLGLDTSSPAVSAGLVRLGAGTVEVLAERVVVDARRHGELLAQGVREVLSAGRPDALVVGTGPGPFTGLRVGLVTASALSDALDVPAYGVCSLDAVGAGERVVVTDARRREVYWARYDASGARTDGPQVERPSDLGDRLRSLPERAPLVGAGAVLHRAAFDGLQVDESAPYPCAPALVRVAASRVLDGAAAEALTPLYLRRPDAVEPGATKRVTA